MNNGSFFRSLMLAAVLLLFVQKTPIAVAEDRGVRNQEPVATEEKNDSGQQQGGRGPRKTKENVSTFRPTEKIGADTVISFPADI